MGEFSLFGDRTASYVMRWRSNPVGWLGNAIGVAYAHIALSWSRGLERLAEPGAGLPPFWRAFHDSYYFDPVVATALAGRYPEKYAWDGVWYPRCEDDLELWQTMTPYIRATLFPLIERFSEVRSVPGCPVLHYRAGDVPFDRSPFYRLPRYRFYDWCIERVEARRWLVVTRLDAMGASPRQVAASARYLDDLRRHLRERGVETEVVDGRSPYDDLYTMIQAPQLMVSMLSSFSYFVGLAKASGRYLVPRSPRLLIERSWIHPELPLAHEEVADYLDVEQVLPLLRTGAAADAGSR